jgi:hypothetical protein
MLDEALELLCDLWSGQPVAHAGRRYRADGDVQAAAAADAADPDLDDLRRMRDVVARPRGTLTGST